ncbi:MAG: bifunctional enoyl-CoA hydratase/phosphate acetyltransferase [Methyloligellaceae bacterium]
MLSTVPVERPRRLLEAVDGLPALRTAVVNATSGLVLESARDAADANIIEPVMFGDADEIRRLADEIGWDIGGLRIVDAAGEHEAAALAAAAAGAGDVDALMKGHVHTDVFMSAALKREAGLRMGHRLSHVFHMTVPGHDEPLLITDGALNTHPDVETKKAIVTNGVDLAHALEIEVPHVALLSATEEPSEHLPSSLHAAELADWAKTNVGRAEVHGPLAFDLTVSAEAARIKGIDHPVAGNADIIVVPDIVSGNALFKMMVYFRSACAAGVVLGAKVPILLTSRADPPEARLASAAIAAVIKHGAAGTPS